jgi:SAM-dependent methyltransferase
MTDPVRELYSQRRYPALSHPEAHPGVMCASARCAGVVSPPLPESCRVLDIGCASGHHLLPLAERFPDSRFHGIDFSDTAIRTARQAAEAAGLKNITFDHADLREWQPNEEGYDYVIAHGMLSWVPDPAKDALLELVSRSLAPEGVAYLSYNTLPGWALRQEAAAMVKALPAAGDDLDARLKLLAETAAMSESSHAQDLAAIFRDMRRKGAEILAFDELAPCCDPMHFSRVLHLAGEKKLRYLGEATLPGNLPPDLDPAALKNLESLQSDPVLFQQTLDLLSGRTHRNSLFCHADTPLDTHTTTSVVLHFAARLRITTLPEKAITGEVVGHFHAALAASTPAARPVADLMEDCARRLGPRWDPERAAKAISSWLYQAARLGWVELRADDVAAATHASARPRLSRLNLHFASRLEPLVDAFHQTCRFPESHRQVVAALDGIHSQEDLKGIARDLAPDLDFDPWLAHLATRGLFVEA